MSEELELVLHPCKRYLQHYKKGVEFTGAYILPHRTYISKRCKGNFYRCVEECNQIIRGGKPSRKAVELCRARLNSYLGLTKHHASYRLRHKMIDGKLSGYWFNHLYISGWYSKMVCKERYRRYLPIPTGVISYGRHP